MKMRTKWLAFLLTLCLLVSSVIVISATSTTEAQTVTKDGIEVTLDHTATEGSVDVIVTITNTSDAAVSDINSTISYPDTLTLTEGNLTKSWNQLNISGSMQHVITISTATPNLVAGRMARGPAPTGDSAMLSLALLVMVASASILAFLIISGRVKMSKSICLLLFAALLFCSLTPTVSAEAAETPSQIQVSKDITVNGETITVSATVNYTLQSATVTRADIEAALAETAWDFFIKDVWIQYDSIDLNTRVDGDNQPLSRWMGGHTRLDTYLSTLEDANSDDTMYSVCSYLPWAVYYEVLDYPLLGCSLNASTMGLWLYAETPDDMLVLRYHNWDENTNTSTLEDGYVTHNKCVTYEELVAFLTNWEDNLRPGDVFYAIDGHAALYVGNGWIIESAGYKLNMVTGADTLESDGSINAWTVEDYFFNEDSGSMYNLSNLFTEGNKRIAILRPLNLLTVSDDDGNLANDAINNQYELDVGRLNLKFSSDPNVLRTSGYTLQNSAISRVAFPAMNIDRTVNITPYGTAAKGDVITYTVAITNESNNAQYMTYHSYGSSTPYTGTAYTGLCITETIPDKTTLVSAPGARVEGSTLYWELDVPVGETVEVSYTVSVTGEIGEKIVSSGGKVADIPTNTITNVIGGEKLSNVVLEEMQEFFAAGPDSWNSNTGYKISAAVDEGTHFAERIYNEVAGLDLQIPDVQELMDILFTQELITEDQGMYYQYDNSVSRYMYTLNDVTENAANQIYRNMLIDGYYGGVWVYTNTYASEPRIDEMRADYLEAGDILVYMNLTESVSGGATAEVRTVDEWRVIVCLGNGQFASLNDIGRLQAISDNNALLVALTYDMFIALRPSQVYADINNDVAEYTATAPDLTEEDDAWEYVSNVSSVLMGERLVGLLADMTAEDGWESVNTAFVGEVYSALGISEPASGVWSTSYASIMKAIFVDTPSESEAYATYEHEYHLMEEPNSGTETIFDMLLYYGGPSFVTKNPVDSLDDLHPGDAILLGLRKERHYLSAVYQGDGNFITSVQSLPGGIFNYGSQWGELSFTTDEEFMNWLQGPIDAEEYPSVCFEGYLVLRPSRVYEDINAAAVRDIKEGSLTETEINILAGLTAADWQTADCPINLNNAAPWFYNSAKVGISKYLGQSIYWTYDALFYEDESSNVVLRSFGDEKFNLDYRIMLVDDSFGGSWFNGAGKTAFVATDFEIGDIFVGAKQVDGSTCYWTALYQGNNNFLVVENLNTGSVSCFTDNESIFSTSIATQWQYFYVLRPNKLTQIRDMALAPLTEDEKTALSALTPDDWVEGGSKVNLNNAAPWAYNAANVDLSGYLTESVYWTYDDLFVAVDQVATLRTSSDSKFNATYNTMLVDGYYGGTYFGETGKTSFTASDFEVGDIFAAAKQGTSKTRYCVAIYQGNGNFLVIENNDTPNTCTIDSSVIYSTNIANEWLYFYVLRPSQLAAAAVAEEPAQLRDITTGKLTSDEEQALAVLTAADWTNSTDNPKNNLNGAGIWMYKSVGIDLSGYLDKTAAGLQGVLFPSVMNETYGESYCALSAVTADNLKYHTMLMDKSWGGDWFAPNDRHVLAQDAFQIGDLFVGRYTDNSKSVYWVALYQGNGSFLIQESHGANGLSCNVKSYENINAVAWNFYYVLRPNNLVASTRDISTGALTAVEQYKLANLAKETWPGNFANLKGSGPWFYSSIGVDVSGYITDNIYGVMDDLFSHVTSESNLTLKEGNTSNYAKMLVNGYYGSREGTKHAQFTADDFLIGDIFCAKGICKGCNKTYYMTAVYQGGGKFLSIVNCGGGSSCVLSCDYDETTVFAADFFAQTDVATWDYYYVLRPSLLANAE